MDEDLGLETADWLVVAASLLAPLCIGILFAVKDRNNVTREEYLLGDRQMSLIPVALSMFITFPSGVSLLGFPGEHYIFGPMICILVVGVCLSYILGYFILIPLVYPLRLTSMYEYLYRRYKSEAVRKMSTIMGMTQTTFYMAVVLLAPALALEASVSIPLWMSIIIIGIVGTAYTAVGGIKSVVWTDVFQTCLLFIGMITVLIKGFTKVGGMTEAMDIARDAGRLSFDKWGPDPRLRHTWGGMVIGMMFTWLSNVFNQSVIQRIESMKSERDAKLSFLLNIPLYILYVLFIFFTGVAVYAYFDKLQCDPLKGGFVKSKDQLLPFYVLHTTKNIPGIAGVFMATLFGGTLSTFSSGINALSANTTEDILRNQLKSFKESTVTFFTKMAVVVYGMLITGLAFAASYVEGKLVQIAFSVFGAFGSPVVGMFLFGSLIPWTNKYGALAGGLASASVNVFRILMNFYHGRKPVPLPLASIENCYSNISSAISAVGNSSLFSLNQTLPGTLEYLFMNQSTDYTVSPYVTDAKFITTTLSPTNTTSSSSSPHDFGFFFFDISYEWGGLIGLIIFAIVGLPVSWLTRKWIKGPVDPQLLLHCSRSKKLVAKISETDRSIDSKDSEHVYAAVPTVIEDRKVESNEMHALVT